MAARLLFDVLAYEVCKLVRVLAHCWHTNSTTPIEVQICELKAQKMCAKMHSMQFGTGGGSNIKSMYTWYRKVLYFFGPPDIDLYVCLGATPHPSANIIHACPLPCMLTAAVCLEKVPIHCG